MGRRGWWVTDKLREWRPEGSFIWCPRPVGFVYVLRACQTAKPVRARVFARTCLHERACSLRNRAENAVRWDHRRESGAHAIFLYWRRDRQFSNCLQRPPVQGKKACTRPYSTPLHTAKFPMQYRNDIRILEPGAPLHSRRIDKNCVADMQRRPL